MARFASVSLMCLQGVQVAQGAVAHVLDSSGAASNVGVLKVESADGSLGTVCGMNAAAADVVCRELGYDFGTVASSGCSAYGGANLCGAAGTPVAMQNVKCTGGELTLAECSWSTPDATCAQHEHDSVVYCGAAAETSDGSVRLLSADGAPSLFGEGVPEIYTQGGWSTVCGITPGAVAVICKALGFPGAAATVVESVTPGQSFSRPNLGNLDCKGTESNVLDCSFDTAADVYCAAAEAAVVNCGQ